MRKHSAVRAVCDRLLVACVAAAIVLATLMFLHPWDAASAAVPPTAKAPMDTAQLVIVRHETTAGVEVLPPEVMPLATYIDTADEQNRREIGGLESAIEQDLHAHDSTFHLTHEYIDHKRW